MKSNNNEILPQGYKMTELGALPEEWEVVRLGEVAEVNYGKANTKEIGNIPVVGSGGVYSSTKTPLVNYPTIIVGRKGTAGKVQLFLDPCYPSDTTFYLSWKKELDVKFLYNYMILNPLSGEYAKTTLPSLQKPDLVNYIFPLPQLPEQQKIANVLSAVQEAKEKTQAVIDATKALKKSMMKHLFTYGPVSPAETENVQLKETEIGPMPENWEVVRLGEYCNIFSGYAFKSDNFCNDGVLVVKIGNLQNGSIVLGNKESLFPREKINDDMAKYVLTEGDILIALTGATTGKISLVPKSVSGALLNQRVGKFSIYNDSLDKSFAMYYFMTNGFQDHIQKNILQSAQGNISPKQIETFKIPLPPLSTQQKIASILSAIDAKIEAEENKKQALEELFKTLLDNLMTAKIRVNTLDVPI